MASLAVANRSSNNVSILIGDGIGHFAPAVEVSLGMYLTPISIDVGKPDLAVGGQNYIAILRGDGAGGFEAPIRYVVGSNVRRMAVADC